MTKFNICIVGMIVGIGLISALPFMGLTRRCCAGVGWAFRVLKTESFGEVFLLPIDIILE
jgi:hypothetical protein